MEKIDNYSTFQLISTTQELTKNKIKKNYLLIKIERKRLIESINHGINTMAETKRRFYNTGDYVGLKKVDFYNAVEALVEGEELDEQVLNFVRDAVAYELESLAIAASKPKKSGEPSDPLHSDYANALRAAVMPFITGNPQTISELQEKMTAAGRVSKNGKSFSIPWIGRVLNAEPGVMKTAVIVDTVGKDGLKAQKQAVAYKK